ncbi:pheromone receptor [Coprinopsis cinerea okayama7|uniref:Pheromone receptor n=1 Tax=Coprinopsis cinerea (strain Okayama-7 / 130 / ATCC MYA-4618 / FGSC 9003) TaxID=240176 RepID=A8NKA5_COPC7|nr:pheromone receptor [Coprinopsis cinerea okayama7\|eukprot:XP_001834393.1 pheromone receptor [Coprinopsis cinerea okayama7\
MAASSDPTYPLYSVFSFIGFILVCIPFWWHIQAWNAGTCAFMIWTALSCLIGFINSLVWKGNALNPAPVWCDISSKIMIGVSIGIPAATLCISRRLYCITSSPSASVTRGDKRKMVVIDLAIAFGIPALVMALHYIVQAHRFDILEDVGCYPVVYNTLPAYFIYFMWPVLLGAISFVYSGLTLRTFWVRRAQFSQLLASTSAMSPSRYIRLMLLAVIDMMCTVPLGVWSIYQGNKGVGLAPWISWEETHYNWYKVLQIPALFWRSDPSFVAAVEMTRWLPVFCAFLFFVLFGFASEARRRYVAAFWFCAKPFGLKPAEKNKSSTTLPSWAKPLKMGTSAATLVSPPAYSQHGPLASSKKSLFSPMSSSKSLEFETTSEKTCASVSPTKPFNGVDTSNGSESGVFSSPTSTKVNFEPLDISLSQSPLKCDFKRASVPSSINDVDLESGLTPSECAESSTSPSSPYLHPSPIAQPSPRRLLDPDSNPSLTSLRSRSSEDRIYLDGRRTPTPSPAPFTTSFAEPVVQTGAPAFHRPFSPPNEYPRSVAPHPNSAPLAIPLPDGIFVTVHTSTSTSSLHS